MALKKIFLIRIKEGAYSNCFYETWDQAFNILKNEIPQAQQDQYEIVEIPSFHRRIN